MYFWIQIRTHLSTFLGVNVRVWTYLVRVQLLQARRLNKEWVTNENCVSPPSPQLVVGVALSQQCIVSAIWCKTLMQALEKDGDHLGICCCPWYGTVRDYWSKETHSIMTVCLLWHQQRKKKKTLAWKWVPVSSTFAITERSTHIKNICAPAIFLFWELEHNSICICKRRKRKGFFSAYALPLP